MCNTQTVIGEDIPSVLFRCPRFFDVVFLELTVDGAVYHKLVDKALWERFGKVYRRPDYPFWPTWGETFWFNLNFSGLI
jgi:hypothetical protein